MAEIDQTDSDPDPLDFGPLMNEFESLAVRYLDGLSTAEEAKNLGDQLASSAKIATSSPYYACRSGYSMKWRFPKPLATSAWNRHSSRQRAEQKRRRRAYFRNFATLSAAIDAFRARRPRRGPLLHALSEAVAIGWGPRCGVPRESVSPCQSLLPAFYGLCPIGIHS